MDVLKGKARLVLEQITPAEVASLPGAIPSRRVQPDGDLGIEGARNRRARARRLLRDFACRASGGCRPSRAVPVASPTSRLAQHITQQQMLQMNQQQSGVIPSDSPLSEERSNSATYGSRRVHSTSVSLTAVTAFLP